MEKCLHDLSSNTEADTSELVENHEETYSRLLVTITGPLTDTKMRCTLCTYN